MTREPDSHEDIQRLSNQERIDNLFQRLDPENRILLNILTDPAITSLDITPPDVFGLVEQSASNSVIDSVDRSYVERYSPTLPSIRPDITLVAERIRYFLPRAISLANLTVSKLLTGERVSSDEIQEHVIKHGGTVVVVHPFPSETVKGYQKDILADIERTPQAVDSGKDIYQHDHPVSVPHSKFETLRNGFLATMLGHEFNSEKYVQSEIQDSIPRELTKFYIGLGTEKIEKLMKEQSVT